MVGHRPEPDVDVEADLVARVSEGQRSAARLRHVADQDAGPAGGLGGARREAFQEAHQFRMAPIAVARQPHHLPVRPVDRQFDAAGETALRVIADGARAAGGRQLLGREQIFRRRGPFDLGFADHRPLFRQRRCDDDGLGGRRRRRDHGLRRLCGRRVAGFSVDDGGGRPCRFSPVVWLRPVFQLPAAPWSRPAWVVFLTGLAAAGFSGFGGGVATTGVVSLAGVSRGGRFLRLRCATRLLSVGGVPLVRRRWRGSGPWSRQVCCPAALTDRRLPPVLAQVVRRWVQRRWPAASCLSAAMMARWSRPQCRRARRVRIGRRDRERAAHEREHNRQKDAHPDVHDVSRLAASLSPVR